MDDFSDEDTDAAFGLGLAYYENDQMEEAIDALSLAIELDAENTDAYYLLGVIFAELGDFARSSEALFGLLEIEEQDADAWFLLGFLYYHDDDQESAAICLAIARDIDSDYDGEDY
ncbi:MAG: tetratricopeptide repeat protein [Haliscomenobacter sp.]|nr:tetratricopeptide repeat protein [Haliscomenobacter sp.]